MIYLYIYLAFSITIVAWASIELRDEFGLELFVLLVGLLIVWPVVYAHEVYAQWTGRKGRGEIS